MNLIDKLIEDVDGILSDLKGAQADCARRCVVILIRAAMPEILEEERRKVLYEFFDWNYGSDSWSKVHVEAFLNPNLTQPTGEEE